MQALEDEILAYLLINFSLIEKADVNQFLFLKKRNRVIFRAAYDLYKNNGSHEIDITTLAEKLEKQRISASDLIEITAGTQRLQPDNFSFKVKKLKEKQLAQKIISDVYGMVKEGKFEIEKAHEYLKEIEKLEIAAEDDISKKPGIFIGSLEQLKEKEVPKDDPLIENLVFRGSLTGVGGVKGSHKSFFANQMALDYSSGYPFLKFKTHGPGRVLLIQQEVSLNHNKLRLNRMQEAGDYDTGERFFPITTTGSQLKLTRDKDLSQIKTWIEEYEPDILILDPLSSFNEAEENTSRDMSKIVNIFNELKSEFNLGLVFTHHFSSKKDPDHPDAPTEAGGWFRGHTVLPDSADALICLHRLPGQRENENLSLSYEDYNLVQIQLRNGKWPERFAIEFNPQTFLLGESNVWQELGKKIIPGEIEDIIEENGGEMLRKDLIEALNDKASYNIIKKAIREAINQGLIESDRIKGRGNPIIYRIKQ